MLTALQFFDDLINKDGLSQLRKEFFFPKNPPPSFRIYSDDLVIFANTSKPRLENGEYPLYNKSFTGEVGHKANIEANKAIKELLALLLGLSEIQQKRELATILQTIDNLINDFYANFAAAVKDKSVHFALFKIREFITSSENYNQIEKWLYDVVFNLELKRQFEEKLLMQSVKLSISKASIGRKAERKTSTQRDIVNHYSLIRKNDYDAIHDLWEDLNKKFIECTFPNFKKLFAENPGKGIILWIGTVEELRYFVLKLGNKSSVIKSPRGKYNTASKCFVHRSGKEFTSLQLNKQQTPKQSSQDKIDSILKRLEDNYSGTR